MSIFSLVITKSCFLYSESKSFQTGDIPSHGLQRRSSLLFPNECDMVWNSKASVYGWVDSSSVSIFPLAVHKVRFIALCVTKKSIFWPPSSKKIVYNTGKTFILFKWLLPSICSGIKLYSRKIKFFPLVAQHTIWSNLTRTGPVKPRPWTETVKSLFFRLVKPSFHSSSFENPIIRNPK